MAAAALVLGWPGAAGAATGWVRQPVPLPPGAMFGMTTAVSCPTAASCTAVGFSNNLVHGNRHLLAEQWAGGAWTVQPAARPAGFTSGVLAGVSCVPPTRCMAVGGYGNGTTGASPPLAETWNGSTWALQSIPNPPGTTGSMPQGISCAPAGACTAVGFTLGGATDQAPLAEHWNGTAWAIQPTPVLSGLASLNGVSCTGPARCMAVGAVATSALAETWNGTTWTVRHAPPHPGGSADDLNGISCTSAASCTAVGGGLAEVRGGSRWAVQQTASPAGHNLFESVSCVAARTCTAVGDGSASASAHQALPLAEQE